MLSKTKRAQIAQAAKIRMATFGSDRTITNTPNKIDINLMKELFGQSKKEGAKPSIMNQLAQCKGFGISKFSRFAGKINAARNKIAGFGLTEADIEKHYVDSLGPILEKLNLAENFIKRKKELSNENSKIIKTYLEFIYYYANYTEHTNNLDLFPVEGYLGLRIINAFVEIPATKEIGILYLNGRRLIVNPQEKIKELYYRYLDFIKKYKSFLDETLKELLTYNTHVAKRILKSFADYTPFIDLVKKEALAYLKNKGPLKTTAPPEDVAKVQFAKICTELTYTKPTQENAEEQTKLALAYYLDLHPEYSDDINAIIDPLKPTATTPIPQQAKILSSNKVVDIKPAPTPSVKPDSSTASQFKSFIKELKEVQARRSSR